MSAEMQHQAGGLRFSRARDGRVLGGVCAGLPSFWGLGTNGVRILFVIAGLCGGLGVIVYLACWLVLPVAGDDPAVTATPGIVLLAGASGGLAGLLLLAGASAALTVFGLGWLAVAAAALVLLAALGPLAKRVPTALALVAVAALAVPSIVVALSPVRLHLQDGPIVAEPASGRVIDAEHFDSGFGQQLIDLRYTRLRSDGVVTMRISAGVRRTIVALPMQRCVKVHISYSVHPFADQLGALLSGNGVPSFHGVVLFGKVYAATSTELRGSASWGTGPGPTLDIDFTSQGGSLYVRDYPNHFAPGTAPNWPGFVGRPEPRPSLIGEPRKVAKLMLRDWHRRRAIDAASNARVRALMGGPCAR